MFMINWDDREVDKDVVYFTISLIMNTKNILMVCSHTILIVVENFLPFEPEVPAAGDTLAQL